MRIDQIMIRSILSDSALGIYAAMLPLSSIWNVVPIIICSSIAPIMARKKNQGDVYFNEALLLIFRIFWLVSILICILTIIKLGGKSNKEC
jgi:PST family polysaccharide transporter